MFAASIEDQHEAPIDRGYQREISAASTVSATSSHGSRFEDTIADFQPPKRYVKEEKRPTPASAAATTFIMVGMRAGIGGWDGMLSISSVIIVIGSLICICIYLKIAC